jgi:hypothetical protein
MYSEHTWKIVHLVIERFGIQLAMSFWIVKINDVAYMEFINLSVYNSIKDKLLKNNMLNIILIE